MIHCSTDLVFDGRNGPYEEDDERRPVGVYAGTKVEAENIALAYGACLVVRLPTLLGPSPSGDRSTDEWICKALAGEDPVTLFVDEYRTPIHTSLAASLMWELLDRGAHGLLHLAGSTRVSRWDLGLALARQLSLPTRTLRAGSVADFQGPIPRCPDVSLRTDRLTERIARPAPTLDESLALLGRP
jgi:dTDP-4-dehydrorhamnose reductase